MRLRLPRRGGFTLVELMVALGLIIVLAALAAGVAYSGIFDSHKMTAGTDRINSWLIQARAKAARQQSPAGIRFIIDGTGTRCTEAQFIEVPDPYIPNPTGRADGYQLVFLYHVPPGGTTPTRELHVITNNSTSYPLTNVFNDISIGDVLSCPEFTSLHRVQAFAPSTTLRRLANPAMPYNPPMNDYQPVQSIQIQVTNASLLPNLGGLMNVPNVPGPPSSYNPAPLEFVPNYATTTFGFLRQPRPTLGEDALQLSAGAVIDISSNGSLPTTLHDNAYLPGPALNPNGYLDVLFSPSGEVLNASQGKIVLWVRNPEFAHPRTSGDTLATYEAAGEMSLIVVYTKTGSVSTQPVNVPRGGAPNPHAYANDGINNGL